MSEGAEKQGAPEESRTAEKSAKKMMRMGPQLVKSANLCARLF
jgi:hypothetical protein